MLIVGSSPYGRLLKADAESVAGFPEPDGVDYRKAIAHLTEAERSEIAVDPSTFRSASGVPQSDSAANTWTGLEDADMDLTTAAARAWHTGRYNRALQAATLRLRQSPDPRATYWLSMTCRSLARQTLARAIELNPDSARAHMVVAEMAKEDGDNERAAAELAQAAVTDPNNAGVRLLYIQFLAGLTKEKSLPQIREAAAKFPSDSRINIELGKALLKNGAHQDAVRAFSDAVAADPNSPVARVGLADANAALGQFDAAIREMRKALPGERDGSLYYRVGKWYQQSGRAPEARAAFEETAGLKGKAVAGLEGRLSRATQ